MRHGKCTECRREILVPLRVWEKGGPTKSSESHIFHRGQTFFTATHTLCSNGSKTCEDCQIGGEDTDVQSR